MCEKSFFFNNILENLENWHARMSYWTNTQEKKERKKNSSSSLLCVTIWNGKEQNEKKKELEGTVVIMETAGFSSFSSYFLVSSFLAKD